MTVIYVIHLLDESGSLRDVKRVAGYAAAKAVRDEWIAKHPGNYTRADEGFDDGTNASD